MRRTILLASVLPFVSAFLGGVLAFSVAMPTFVEAQEGRIQAEQFTIVGITAPTASACAPARVSRPAYRSSTPTGNSACSCKRGLQGAAEPCRRRLAWSSLARTEPPSRAWATAPFLSLMDRAVRGLHWGLRPPNAGGDDGASTQPAPTTVTGGGATVCATLAPRPKPGRDFIAPLQINVDAATGTTRRILALAPGCPLT